MIHQTWKSVNQRGMLWSRWMLNIIGLIPVSDKGFVRIPIPTWMSSNTSRDEAGTER
jgi:hypothetical protein